MPKKNMKQLADILAENVLRWTVEKDQLEWEEYKIAALIDIMLSLRAIRGVLECGNTQRAALSMQALERLAREFWVKPTKKTGRKTAPAPRGRHAAE